MKDEVGSSSATPEGRAARTSAVPTPRERPDTDPYVDLLRERDTLTRDTSAARSAWFATLRSPGQEEALFELEILLKGLSCFANPRNHPGSPRRSRSASLDYRDALVMARDAMERILSLCRTLLGARERAFAFQRYVEILMPDDTARARLQRSTQAATSPEDSLLLLKHTLTHLVDVTSAVVRGERVPFRLFYATLSIAQREIAQSTYFQPLTALEFRPEFDRIGNPRLLELMQQEKGEQARRLVALTILSLFRMLRYSTLLERVLAEPQSNGVAYVIFSVFRSDARAFTDYLRKQAGEQLAGSYEHELEHVACGQMASTYDALLAEAHRLLTIKATLVGIAANVRLELRRAFEHDVPPAEAHASTEQLRHAWSLVASNLRPALQNGVLMLGKVLGTRLDEHGIFDDVAARQQLSKRLRRDIWMFAQIVRAFGAKARSAPSPEDRWSGPSALQFVREFLAYFQSMGYPLLRAADAPGVDSFIATLSALDEADLLDPKRLQRAVLDATRCYESLTHLFEQIGQRDELANLPFDRRGAAEALKLYLTT
jgi:hypothetical protein